MGEIGAFTMATSYPLLCGFHEHVRGKNFFAMVAASGRALAVEEAEGEWWIYGVNPGGFSASGQTLQAAHAQLRETFRQYLEDVANEAADFDAFHTEVNRFFHATNRPTEEEWHAAVERVRSGDVTLKGMPQAPANSEMKIVVALVAQNDREPVLAA